MSDVNLSAQSFVHVKILKSGSRYEDREDCRLAKEF